MKYVGTATIGIDHLDIPYLESNNIQWANAAGCNAAAVAQYVLSAIAFWCLDSGRDIKDLTIGIVGAGNVGTELARCLDFLGIKFLLNDPPLQNEGDPRTLVTLEQVLACDVITLHVPNIAKCPHSTNHLINAKFLGQLNNNQLLINASRGNIIDNSALEAYLLEPNPAQFVLDVFENEPAISHQLISKCLLATPHIAGHTLEGKLRGSWMVYRSFCNAFNIEPQQTESALYPQPKRVKPVAGRLEKQLLMLYNIQLDSDGLKQVAENKLPILFDQLRKNATQLSNGWLRRDYSGYKLPKELSRLAN